MSPARKAKPRNDAGDFVKVPRATYEALIAAREELDELRDAEAGKRARAADMAAAARIGAAEDRPVEALVPFEITSARLDGAHPIKAWRDYRGITQARLAAAAGISRSYLAQIETGKRAGTTDALRSIARVLGVLLDDLVDD